MVNILCIGDSGCFGQLDSTGMQATFPYEVQLYNLLTAKSPFFTRSRRGGQDKNGLINQGQGSRTVAALTTLVGSLIEPYCPNIVVITCGLQDVATGSSLATLQANYLSLYSQIHALGALVIQDEMLPDGLPTDQEAVRVACNSWFHTAAPVEAATLTSADPRMAIQTFGAPSPFDGKIWYGTGGHPTDSNAAPDIGGGYGVKALYLQTAVYEALAKRFG